MKQLLETRWFCQNGSPNIFSADPEFFQPVLESFLHAHEVKLAQRPSRSSHNDGVVETNNGLFKAIMAMITKEENKDPPTTYVSRLSLLTNILHVSSILRSF